MNMMNKLMNSTMIIAAAGVLTACGQATMPAQMTLPHTQSMHSQAIENTQQELIVRFNPNASRQELFQFNQKYGLQTQGFIEGLNAYVVRLRQPIANQGTFRSMINQMSAESVTLLVEVNQSVQVAPVPYDMMISPIF